jgi:hypothetical protein
MTLRFRAAARGSDLAPIIFRRYLAARLTHRANPPGARPDVGQEKHGPIVGHFEQDENHWLVPVPVGRSRDEETNDMGYRGEDLDLRTPGSAKASPSEITWTEAPSNGRNRAAPHGGPIWVDEAVLSCCNHAFDLAVSHRAAEVRLEHLLHAMTRIDTAAELLEDRGVRVAALRRDSAGVVANEIPVAPAGSSGRPRRAEELEDVLRVAGQFASARRNSAANLDDLVQTLVEMRAELPGLGLLRRHGPRRGRDFSGSAGSLRGTYGADSHFVDVDHVRTRLRGEAESGYYTEPARALRADYGSGQLDVNRDSRLDQLEQMVWTLGNELATERRAFASLLQEFQRDVLAQRDEATRIGSTLSDRLDAIEHSVKDAVTETGRVLATVSEKVALINEGMASRQIDLEPVTNRLEVIEEAVLAQDGDAISPKLEAMQTALISLAGLKDDVRALTSSGESAEKRAAALLNTALEPVLERLQLLSDASVARATESARRNTEHTSRFDAIQTLLNVLADRSGKSAEAQDAGVTMLHDALVKISDNQLAFAGSLDQWRLETAGDLDTLSQNTAKPVQLLELLSVKLEALHRATVERYHRRNRFWHWLFGTDDWVTASWPTQVAAIDAERKSIKPPAAH